MPNPIPKRIGEIADRADNFYRAGLLPMPAEFTANQLREAMKDLRDELRTLHVEATGENPWEDHNA